MNNDFFKLVSIKLFTHAYEKSFKQVYKFVSKITFTLAVVYSVLLEEPCETMKFELFAFGNYFKVNPDLKICLLYNI